MPSLKTRSAARLIVAAATVVIALFTSVTATASPLPFPFAGSSGGQPTEPPNGYNGPDAAFILHFVNTLANPQEITVKLIDYDCATLVDPGDINGQTWVLPPNGRQYDRQFAFDFFQGIRCLVNSSNATWSIETKTPRGTDITTVRFRSYQGDNSLEWQQTTTAGKNPVFIERPSDGLKFTIR